ncbi:hypothetical protein SDC9_97607 [bioreactor metagenome]|uniref:Uncharacterized protein n=1 Tax=bioreactor metagenome TaxID=1076179 RepID=A0A645AEZ5_9ZZZZ
MFDHTCDAYFTALGSETAEPADQNQHGGQRRRRAVAGEFPERNADAITFRALHGDDVGETADDDQIAGEGVGHGQRVAVQRLSQVGDLDQQHHRRRIIDAVAQHA